MSDVYDFSLEDSAESSGEQQFARESRPSNKSGRVQSSSTRGASSSAGGSFSRNASRASALDALSPPTPTDSSTSDSEFNVGATSRGGRARSSSGGVGVTSNSALLRPGSYSRTGQSSVASGSGRASLDVSSASGAGGSGLTSIEERVAARLASLQVERLAKLSSLGGGSSVAQTVSADVSAISGVNSSGSGLGSGFVTPAGINSSIASASRGVTVPSGSVNSSAVVGGRRNTNTSVSRPEVILSPLSAGGDLDSSSSVDMSSADFQVGAIAARALAARRAASVALSAASQGKTVIEATRRRDESDAEHSDEGDNESREDEDAQETPYAEKTDVEESEEDDGYENDDGDESSADLQSTFTHPHNVSPPREQASVTASASVTSAALQPASTNTTVSSVNPKKDPFHLTFAELAMMMREEAALAKKVASSSSTSVPPSQSEQQISSHNSVSAAVVITSPTVVSTVTPSVIASSSLASSQTSEGFPPPTPPPVATPFQQAAGVGFQSTNLSSSQIIHQQVVHEQTMQAALYKQQQQLQQSNAVAAVTRSLRAAAAAALSKQLQSAAAAQRSSIVDEESDALVPSAILKEYVDSDVFSRGDSEVDHEDAELENNARVADKKSARPPRAPFESFPLRAPNIRAAVESVGLSLGASTVISSRSSSRRSSRSSRSESLDRVPNTESQTVESNKNAFARTHELQRSPTSRPKLPFPVRMTRSQRQRAIASRAFRRSTEEAASREETPLPFEDNVNDDSDTTNLRNASIKFRFVTKDGEYIMGDDENSSGVPLPKESQRVSNKTPPPTSKSPPRRKVLGSENLSPRYTRAQLHASIYGPVRTNSVNSSRGRSESRQPRESNESTSPPPPPPPIDTALANALIADAAAARFAAESRASELATTVSVLEAKLKHIEDGTTVPLDNSPLPPTLPLPSTILSTITLKSHEPSLQLYSLLREAISHLTVFQQQQQRAVNEFLPEDVEGSRAINGGAVHTTSRFMKERSGPRREWSPLGPSSGSTGPVAQYFDEVPVSHIVTAAESDGFRAFVPLALVEALQKELAAQEKMIATYHVDNQRLRGDLLKASESGIIAKDEPGKGLLQPKSHFSSATDVNINPGASSSEIIERLRSELAEVHESHLVREGELAREVERLRRAKMDLECKVNGVDMDAIARDSEEVLKLRAESTAAKVQHEREIAALNTKIAWYRDNQTIVDTDTATIAQQAETIRDLQERLRLSMSSSPRGSNISPKGKTGGPSTSTSPNSLVESSSPTSPLNGRLARSGLPSDPERDLALAQKRIKQLEADLRVAEDAMSKRHPDSIANLIREAKGSTQAVGEPAVVLAELEKLKAETAETEDGQDRRLRALRQEHERLRAEYERREAALKDEASGLRARLASFGDSGAISPGPGGTADEGISRRELALRGRVKELETELERIRAFYAKKVREERSGGGTPSGSSPSNQALSRIAATTANVYMTSRSSPSSSLPPSSSPPPPPHLGGNGIVSISPGGGGESDVEDNLDSNLAAQPSEPSVPLKLDSASKSVGKTLLTPLPRRSSVSSNASEKTKTQLNTQTSVTKKGKSGTPVNSSSVLTPKTNTQSSNKPSTSLASKSKTLPPRKGEKSVSPTPKNIPQSVSPVLDEEAAGETAVSVTLPISSQPESSTKDEGLSTQALLSQVARLESENARILAEKAAQVEAALGSPEGRASSHVLYLQRQVEQLYAAIGVLEARADSRDAELARAELRAMHAKEAGEILARAHFAEALQAKDDALRAARNELADLVDAFRSMQKEQETQNRDGIAT